MSVDLCFEREFNIMYTESAPDLNKPRFEAGTQWSEVECSTTRPSMQVHHAPKS